MYENQSRASTDNSIAQQIMMRVFFILLIVSLLNPNVTLAADVCTYPNGAVEQQHQPLNSTLPTPSRLSENTNTHDILFFPSTDQLTLKTKYSILNSTTTFTDDISKGIIHNYSLVEQQLTYGLNERLAIDISVPYLTSSKKTMEYNNKPSTNYSLRPNYHVPTLAMTHRVDLSNRLSQDIKIYINPYSSEDVVLPSNYMGASLMWGLTNNAQKYLLALDFAVLWASENVMKSLPIEIRTISTLTTGYQQYFNEVSFLQLTGALTARTLEKYITPNVIIAHKVIPSIKLGVGVVFKNSGYDMLVSYSCSPSGGGISSADDARVGTSFNRTQSAFNFSLGYKF